MRFLLCVLLSILLISCGGDSGSSGSSSRGNSNTPPTAQDVTIDTGHNDFITYDLSSDINDVETAKSDLVIEVVDKPKYSTTGELTENCPLDNNNTGKIMWNSNAEFYYDMTMVLAILVPYISHAKSLTEVTLKVKCEK